MKKLVLVFALLMGVTSFYNTAEAQNISININIGRQPAWGPVGYDYAGYYYFPDIDIYYDVNVGLFYFLDRGRWVSAHYLPYAYRNYDLYRLYKVVLNVNQPWRYHHNHYRDYARYRGHKSVLVIRDSREARYRDSRNNRVVWYSDKKYDNRRDYNNHNNRYYSNDKKTNDRQNRNDNYRSDNRRDNSKNSGSGKNYNSGRDNNKSNNNYSSRQDRSRSDKNNSSPAKSNRDNSKNERVKQDNSSSRSNSNYRLASNSERGGRTR